MSHELRVEKLKGLEGYHDWSFAMESFLDSKSLGDCIKPSDDDEALPKESKASEIRKAKGYLVLAIDTSLYVHIRLCPNSLDIWSKLKTMYEDRGILRRMGLLQKFVSVRLENCASMQECIDNITSHATKLTSAGWSLTDEWLAGIYLIGLPEDYRPLLMSFEGRKDVITSDEVKIKLLDLEQKPRTSNDAAFLGRKGAKTFKKGQNRTITCYSCGGKNHKSVDCMAKSKPKTTETAKRHSQRASWQNHVRQTNGMLIVAHRAI